MSCRWFFLFPLIACCSHAVAQITNIRLSETAADATRDPSIAINPKNPLNIVAASARDQVYVTNDGGKTWKSQTLSSTFGVDGAPVVVADSKGTFYLFHLTGSGDGEENPNSIICQMSSDGGATWDGGTPVVPGPGKGHHKPWASIDGKGNVHVTWTQADKLASSDSTCQSVVMLSSSSNGKKWTKPVQISNLPGDCSDNGNTAAGAVSGMSDDKKLYVAWSNRNKIYLDRSFDGGGMWLSNDIVVGDHPGGWKMVVPGHADCTGMPVLVVDRSKAQSKGLIYLVWADQRSGENNTDIWFMRSNNFGDYWSTPMKVGGDQNDKHQYMPRMTIDNTTGYLYIVYYDRSDYDDNQTDVFLAYSRDAGSTFKTIKISESPFIPDESASLGDYVNISAHKGVITPIWTRMDEGKTSIWTAVIREDQLPK